MVWVALWHRWRGRRGHRHLWRWQAGQGVIILEVDGVVSPLAAPLASSGLGDLGACLHCRLMRSTCL